MNRITNFAEIVLWGVVCSIFWTLYSVICTIVFFENINHIALTQLTPELTTLLSKLLATWAIVGFVCGVIAIFTYIYLVNLIGSLQAYPVHLFQMSMLSLLLGGLLGGIFYPILTLPEGIVLKSFFWRIPISAIIALFATVTALRFIGSLGGSQRRSRNRNNISPFSNRNNMSPFTKDDDFW